MPEQHCCATELSVKLEKNHWEWLKERTEIDLPDNFPLPSWSHFRALGTKPSWIDKVIGAILRATDANVIAVDWVYGSTVAYFSAVGNVVKLGLEISSFLKKLMVSGEKCRKSLGYFERRLKKKNTGGEAAGQKLSHLT